MFTVAVAGFAVVPQIAVAAFTERVSVATDGTQADGGSDGRQRSAPTGASWRSRRSASNLVPGDTNGVDDVFVRDRRSGTTGGSAWAPAAPRRNDATA